MKLTGEALDAYLRRRELVLSKVRHLLIASLELDRGADEIDPDTALFGTGMGLDSVDAVEVVIGLETEFGIRLTDPDERRRALRSVNALVDVVMAHPDPRATEGLGVSAAEIAAEVGAVRASVVLSRRDHVAVVRVEGPDAFALLDATSPGPLFLRESQMRHTLLLDGDARPEADLYVCHDEDGFFLLADGLTEEALVARIEARRAERLPASELAIRPMSATHELLGLDGPYAWELAAALLGPSVLGMPYLTLLRADDAVCFRAGKTGEYGYDLLVPRGSGFPSRIAELGAAFDLRPVSLAALDVCALENWHFSIRIVRDTPLARPLTPLELQLQWRVDYRRDFVGAEALRARRAAGAAVRATSFVAAAPVAAGDALALDGERCGEVLAAVPSPTLGGVVGIGLLRTRLAHPGLELEVAAAGGLVTATTRTPPLVLNRSLFIDSHRHSYRTRASDTFPPLVMP